MRNNSHRRAFTFAEILVAMVFVAIVIPVAVEGVLIANRAGTVAERKRVAARLADRLLAELVLTGEWADASGLSGSSPTRMNGG